MYILILQRLFLEAIFDLVNFPLWWYTAGTKRALLWCFDFFKTANRELAPGLWLANLFVPMFGQFDWQGRIISFLMRLVQFCARSLVLLIWAVVCLALFFVWLAWPVIVLVALFQAIIAK